MTSRLVVIVLASPLETSTERITAGNTVPKKPVTFHQYQNTSSIKNAKVRLVETPHNRPRLTCVVPTFFVKMPSKKTAKTGPKKTEPTLLTASITVGAMSPALSESNKITTPHINPANLALRR